MPASRVLPWRRGIAAPAVETAPLIATFHSRHPKAPSDTESDEVVTDTVAERTAPTGAIPPRPRKKKRR